jgi:hypothetical protein
MAKGQGTAMRGQINRIIQGRAQLLHALTHRLIHCHCIHLHMQLVHHRVTCLCARCLLLSHLA